MNRSANGNAKLGRRVSLASAASSVALFAAPAAAQELRGIGDLPGGIVESTARGVSADGAIVVGGTNSTNGIEAAMWTASGGLVGLGDLPGGLSFSLAQAVSADGSTIVGWGYTAAGQEGFRWRSGIMTPIGVVPGMTESQALAVSADGSVIAGISTNAAGHRVGFRWMAGVLTPLGDLGGSTPFTTALGVSGDGAIIVGRSTNAAGVTQAFRWTQATGMVGLNTLAATPAESSATAISANGLVIVGHEDDGVTDEAVRWLPSGEVFGLGSAPGGYGGFANAVNADGSVIVGTSYDSRGDRAFYWTPREGSRAVAEMLALAGVNLGGWSLDDAFGVSADGAVVVGEGVNPSGDREGFWVRLTSVAAPTAPILSLPLGLGEIGGMSGDGSVVIGYTGTGRPGDRQATRWTATGGVGALGDLPGGEFDSLAFDVNYDGRVIVGRGASASGREAFRWESGVMRGLGVLPGFTGSYATGVSDDGSVVVGTSDDMALSRFESFRWTSATGLTPLGHLDPTFRATWAEGVSGDGAVVIGVSINNFGLREAFRWTQTLGIRGLGFLGAGNDSSAVAANLDGSVIVGNSTDAAFVTEAFRWTPAANMVGLGFLPGYTNSIAMDVSASGAVVVGYSASGPSRRAFYWTVTDGMRSLEQVVSANGVNIGTWQLNEVSHVSADGTVVAGYGVNPSGSPENFWLRIAASPPPPTNPGGGNPPTDPGGGNPPPTDPGGGNPPPTDPGGGNPPPTNPGGGNPPPTNPGGGNNDPQPPSGFLSESVLALSASSTQAIVSVAMAGASLDGTMSMGVGGDALRNAQVADGGHIMTDASAHLDASPRRDVGELRAWALGGAQSYSGDVSEADGFDGVWGVSYQATRTLRVGAGLRYLSLSGDLPAYEGEADFHAYALQGFVAYEPEAMGLRAYFAASAGRNEAEIHRGYLNGVDPVTSSGTRKGESYAASMYLGWRFGMGDDVWLTPFARIDAMNLRLDAYTETGGPFPARFNAIDETFETGRAGVQGGMPVGRALDLTGSLAWAHRGDERLPSVTGQLIGLQGFGYAGAALDPDWAEADVGLRWAARDGVNVRLNLGATTDGDLAPTVSGMIGVDMRL